MEKTYTFKQLVAMLAGIKNEDDFNNVTCAAIKHSFEADKITYKDYELLWDLAEKIYFGINKKG